MGFSSMIILCIIGIVFKEVLTLPCLSTDSKTKFEATRKALREVQTSIDERVTRLQTDMKNKMKKLDGDMGSLQTDIKNKIQKLDKDMESLVSDFQKKQWRKYNGHCYYFGSEALTWFKSEQRCRQIGGHLAKIDDEAENKWIMDNRIVKSSHWMGLTDLKEGEYRWSYDQTLAKYKPWYSGWGNKGTSYNCGLMYNGTYTWLDYVCTNSYHYVCESHICY